MFETIEKCIDRFLHSWLPDLKQGFYNQAQAAVKRLTALCSQLIRHAPADTPMEEEPSTSAQAPANLLHPSSTCNGLYIKMQQDLALHFLN